MLWRRLPRAIVRVRRKERALGLIAPRRHNRNYSNTQNQPAPLAKPPTEQGETLRENMVVELKKGFPENLSEGGNKDSDLATNQEFRNDTPSTRFTHAELQFNDQFVTPNTISLTGRVTVAGLVRSIRKQKRIAFAHIQDGSTYKPIQATMDPELATNLSNGAYAEFAGTWKPSPGKGQSYELQVESVDNIGESNAEENPIQKQSMTAEYLRSIPHMRIRTPFQSLLARTRSHLIRSTGDFFENDVTPSAFQIHPPLITSSDCEGAGEVFTMSPQSYSPPPGSNGFAPTKDELKLFFRDQKYLTVSSQLHLEAWSAELGDVWTLSPTFRAEESDTARHLAEFYMLEAEFRGATALSHVTSAAQSLLRNLAHMLADHRTGRELLELYADRKHRPGDRDPPDLEERWSKLTAPKRYPQIRYSEAIRELQNWSKRDSFQQQPSWEGGLSLEHERWIVENLGKGLPIIVKHYPKKQKPFYMLPTSAALDFIKEECPEEYETVACFDILLPYGYAEVCGGSLREHRLPNLIEAMREKNLLKQGTSNEDSSYPYLQPGESLGNLQWYADLRRFGSSPHGGFGLGFDRLLAYLTGASSVRDVVGFPRYWGRAEC